MKSFREVGKEQVSHLDTMLRVEAHLAPETWYQVRSADRITLIHIFNRYTRSLSLLNDDNEQLLGF